MTNIDEVTAARNTWTAATQSVIKERRATFGEGSGFGDPDAREAALQRLTAAETEAGLRLHEYQDLNRGRIEEEMLQLQRPNGSPRGSRLLWLPQ